MAIVMKGQTSTGAYKNLSVSASGASVIGGVGACKLTKLGTVSEVVTCTNANTDYPMANAMVAGTQYLVASCASAIIVSMGEATSATIGVLIAPYGPPFPVTVTGTAADDKAHVQSATAGAVVRFTSMAD